MTLNCILCWDYSSGVWSTLLLPLLPGPLWLGMVVSVRAPSIKHKGLLQIICIR